MQNLNRDAMSGIQPICTARYFKLMRWVAHSGQPRSTQDFPQADVILALRQLGLPKMSAGPGRLDIE